jgi:aryl-alcohol dehydrogenase-like predicted oxidoreductase
MKMNRREFITTLAAGAGATALARTVPAGAGSAASVDPFRLVPLGRTGLQVSLIGIGTGTNGFMRESNMTRMGKEPFITILRHAVDRGVRLVDTADLYGTHPFVAEALKAVPREKIVLCSKIWLNAGGLPESERPDADKAVDRFRRELNTDIVDLVLIHCMTDGDWPERMKRQTDILADLKAKGVIRAHGASIHSLDALEASASCPWVDSVHARINAFGEVMDEHDPKAVAPVIGAIHKAGKGVVGMKLVGGGRFRHDPDRIDKSIEYVLGLGTVDTMVVGFESIREVDDFAARVEKALKKQAG